jgi:dUTP pyrophosphatase
VTAYQPATGRPTGTGNAADPGNAAAVGPAVDAVPVLVKRLDPGLPLPVRAHAGDAGVDLCAAAEVTLGPGERAVVPTGVAIALPDGYAAFVHPRSGLAARHGVTIVNAPGTVDAGYRGEIKVTLLNTDRRQPVRFGRGDRIAQLVIQRVAVPVFHEVASLPGSARGDGGFGSTGGHAAASGKGARGPAAGSPHGGDEIMRNQGA